MLVAALSAAPARADKTNPDFIPPDITLPMSGGMPQPAPATTAPSGQPAPGQAGAGGQGGYPGFTMPGSLGSAPPGLGGVNPFLMKGADRLRQPPGTHFASKGMADPSAAGGAPPAGSSAYGAAPPVTGGMPYPGSAQPGQQANLSTSIRMADHEPTAVIATDKGTITIMLFRQYAPKTVAAFMDMVREGFYNGLTFHRIVPGFVIQGGCPKGDGTGNYIPRGGWQERFLDLEVSPNVRHNAPGVVAMARMPGKPNSSSCQFYITLAPQPSLDNQYTIFGGVTDGMEVVKRITKGDRINSITVSE
jgi:cyclophilin family peptidyl-prolyl cis-trans isomerase